MDDYRTWTQEDAWWRANYSARPYAAGHEYDEFRPAYQYGFESAREHEGKTWRDVESSLRSGWDKFEGKRAGGAAWENVKDAIKDAWHRALGEHRVDTDKMADFERDRLSGGVSSGSRKGA